MPPDTGARQIIMLHNANGIPWGLGVSEGIPRGFA